MKREKWFPAYLQQSISNMDPCLFWSPPLIYSGNKNALKENRHISLNESWNKNVLFFFFPVKICSIAGEQENKGNNQLLKAAAPHYLHSGSQTSKCVAGDWATLAPLHQYLPHHGLCKAESPSHQQCWFPNYPSGQTLWSVTKRKLFYYEYTARIQMQFRSEWSTKKN